MSSYSISSEYSETQDSKDDKPEWPEFEKPEPLFDAVDIFGLLFIFIMVGPNLQRPQVEVINVTGTGK